MTIKELAEIIVDVTGYENDYEWDISKPNGTPRKVLNVDKMKALGWEPKISLREGIESTYEWYKNNLDYKEPEPEPKLNPISRFMSWMDQ